MPWYRVANRQYSSGDECVIHEAACVVDTPRVMEKMTVSGVKVSLIAESCHQLYDPPTQ